MLYNIFIKKLTYLFMTNLINYNQIIELNKRVLTDSVKAAQFEGSETVAIDADKIISLFADKLTPAQYAEFNFEKAEDLLFDFVENLMKA